MNTELQVTQVEIAALTPILVSLPDGETREEYRRKIERLDSRLKVLNNRKADFGALALLQVEWEVARLDQEIEESDAFITALNARKAAL